MLVELDWIVVVEVAVAVAVSVVSVEVVEVSAAAEAEDFPAVIGPALAVVVGSANWFGRLPSARKR